MTAGSPSLEHADYWWYLARERLLAEFFAPYATGPALMLDIGSADGPSVSWLDRSVRRIAVDLDPRGLSPGQAVTADVMRLPFRADAFDMAGAFDVLEHCRDDAAALTEVRRVLRPGGTLLVSVPAYQWAWSQHDVHNGHLRRYTRARLLRLLAGAGFRVLRSSYAFAGVFPFFAGQRLVSRLATVGRPPAEVQDVVSVPRLPRTAERMMLGLSQVDRWLLRRTDLAFGSSVFAAALRPD